MRERPRIRRTEERCPVVRDYRDESRGVVYASRRERGKDRLQAAAPHARPRRYGALWEADGGSGCAQAAQGEVTRGEPACPVPPGRVPARVPMTRASYAHPHDERV